MNQAWRLVAEIVVAVEVCNQFADTHVCQAPSLEVKAPLAKARTTAASVLSVLKELHQGAAARRVVLSATLQPPPHQK